MSDLIDNLDIIEQGESSASRMAEWFESPDREISCLVCGPEGDGIMSFKTIVPISPYFGIRFYECTSCDNEHSTLVRVRAGCEDDVKRLFGDQ